MTIERINKMIDIAIEDAAIRPQAMKETNALNAEYALGMIFAFLGIIRELYGIDLYIENAEKRRDIINELTERAQAVYKA